jgi:uncharacterized protein YecE (DUF72 family)
VIRVGTAGWSYPDWEGVVYPRRKGAGFHPLRHLARYLSCVEINSSFYATPNADHAERWVRMVEGRERFRFIVKLQNLFTHQPLPSRDLDLQRGADDFLTGIEPLRRARRLTGLLVQFPHSFRASEASARRLELLAEVFGHLPLLLEVRHGSWYESAPLKRVRALGYSLIHLDLPYAADHPPAEAPIVGATGYLRVHGRNAASWFDARAGRDQRYDYLYPPDEVAGLARTARRLAAATDETFVITNNHFAGKAVANALEMLAVLEERPPLAPAELVEAYPHLRSLTRVDGQQTLFT